MRFLFLMPLLAGTNTEQGQPLRVSLAQRSEVRVSPDQFEPQLNLARGRGCRADNSRVRGLEGIVRVVQKIWRCKVGVIQNVEEL